MPTSRSALGTRLRDFLQSLLPARTRIDTRERIRVFLGAGLGILCTALLARWWSSSSGAGTSGVAPWLAAPLGASAVLVFALPASPLAQPWSVVGGNVLSALVGAACARWVPDAVASGAIAVALAIALMFSLRCLHPPGGATALLCAMGGAGFDFAVRPMLMDSVLLVIAGILYNSATGRPYPHRPPPRPATAAPSSARFSSADLDAALAHYNQVLDVSRDDLEELLHHAEAEAYRRNFGALSCAEIMSPAPVTVQFGTPLDEAWALLRERRIKALPVVDRGRHVVGIVTVADFMRHAGFERREGIAARLRAFLRREGAVHTDKPQAVGQIMTREVRVVSADRRVAELVPLFSEGGHHHIPVIDADRRLAGIITQSDLVRALYRVTQAP